MIRILSKIFDRKNKQQAASKESLSIILHITKCFGETTAKVLLSLIYQYPERVYYDAWFFPQHKDLAKLLNLTDMQYNAILTKLVKAGLIRRKKDREYKTHKMMYMINFENVNRFQYGVPKDMVTI